MPEFINRFKPSRPPRVAVLDFDGTLSLLRAGWVELMVGMMVDVLRPLPGTKESESDLTEFVTDFVLNLTGRATIFQMEYFVKTAKQRGGSPDTPDAYTRTFLDQLNAMSERRIDQLHAGDVTTDDLLVPGTRALLTDLTDRGVELTLASGTPGPIVRREAKLLEIDHFFKGRIFGPEEDWRAFSKLEIMRSVLRDSGVQGDEFLGIGDGFVEISDAKEVGGIAIGCASDEVERSGRVEDWKRTRLIRAGADVIIPDYRNWSQLAKHLFSA